MKDKIEKILKEAGVQYKFIPLPEDLAPDIESHAKFHGIELKDALPTFVFMTEKGLIAVQRRHNARIDNKKLRNLTGLKKIRIANEKELSSLGLKAGIVPPLGFNVPFYMDEKVFENDTVYTGSGDKLFALKMDPRDIAKLNKTIIGDLSSEQEVGPRRVLSGIRATGRLHLGNYLGAVKGFLELEKSGEYETFYMVVDLHTMTTPFNPKTLAESSREIILDYLACGLDPEKSAIFLQSSLADLHAELAFYFSTVVTVARMLHLPTYKEKIRQHPDNVTMALLNYPVLMAADILIYKAGLVPVGIDQEPHLEVTREIARKMNDAYGTDFPEPQRFKTPGEYVPSLLGEGKMSKSVEGSYISLTDDLATIKRKLSVAPTNSGKGTIRFFKKSKNFAAYNMVLNEDGIEAKSVEALLKFVELFEGEERRLEYEKQYTSEGIKYSELKAELADVIFKQLLPIQERRKALQKSPEYVENVLREGAEKARRVASKTVKEVREKTGIK